MICALLAGCGSSESPAAAVEGDVLKIGIFEPATGENGAGGMQEVLGARYANKVVPSVTVNGKEYKIELVEVDNQSDKTAAVTAAQNLVSSGVIAVIGSYGLACPSPPAPRSSRRRSPPSAAPARTRR